MTYLMDLALLSLDDASVEKIGSKIGQDKGTTSAAIDAALPLLLSAVNRSAKEDGAAGLDRALETKHDGSVLDDVAGFLDNDDQSDGQGILGHILGANSGAAAKVLGASAGIGASQASSLMATLAPILMGAIGKTRQEQQLSPRDLRRALDDEEQEVDRRSPTMLGAVWRLLDADGDGDTDIGDLMKHGARGLGGFLRK